MKENVTEKKREAASFAGGCFWCMEAEFERLEGVVDVVSGYAGGHTKNPTYEQVCSGATGHREAILVTFDPAVISYEQLLDFFWTQIDPYDEGGQFVDRGHQYTTAIFYNDDEQKKIAAKSKKELEEKSERKIATEILPFTAFFEAEAHHQDYHRTCPLQYRMYKMGSGRERRLRELWQKK